MYWVYQDYFLCKITVKLSLLPSISAIDSAFHPHAASVLDVNLRPAFFTALWLHRSVPLACRPALHSPLQTSNRPPAKIWNKNKTQLQNPRFLQTRLSKPALLFAVPYASLCTLLRFSSSRVYVRPSCKTTTRKQTTCYKIRPFCICVKILEYGFIFFIVSSVPFDLFVLDLI